MRDVFLNWQEITSYNYSLNRISLLDYKKKPAKSKDDKIDMLWCWGAAVVFCSVMFAGVYFMVI